jgi:Tfp pilus assembly protein PilO
MPRIVTTHNITIEPESKGTSGGKGAAAAAAPTGQLKMKATAKTYRALEEEEEA